MHQMGNIARQVAPKQQSRRFAMQSFTRARVSRQRFLHCSAPRGSRSRGIRKLTANMTPRGRSRGGSSSKRFSNVYLRRKSVTAEFVAAEKKSQRVLARSWRRLQFARLSFPRLGLVGFPQTLAKLTPEISLTYLGEFTIGLKRISATLLTAQLV